MVKGNIRPRYIYIILKPCDYSFNAEQGLRQDLKLKITLLEPGSSLFIKYSFKKEKKRKKKTLSPPAQGNNKNIHHCWVLWLEREVELLECPTKVKCKPVFYTYISTTHITLMKINSWVNKSYEDLIHQNELSVDING